jgi:hypothetical protein
MTSMHAIKHNTDSILNATSFFVSFDFGFRAMSSSLHSLGFFFK